MKVTDIDKERVSVSRFGGSEPPAHGICTECYAMVKSSSPSLSTHIEGPCLECHEITEAVVLFDRKPGFLCVACQQKIRAGVL